MTTPVTKTHLDCPECKHKGCFTEFHDGGAFCHSCGFTGKGSKLVEVEEEVTESIRGISTKVCKLYGITVGHDSMGNPVRHTYPYPHKDKYRWLPKDFSKNSGFSNDHLFGMDKFNASSGKVLTIVEGELDAASAYQMLGERWPVVSLPNASLSRQLLKNCHEYMDSFSEIVVATDGDSAGEAVAIKLANVFLGKVSTCKMTKHKDANAFLQAKDESDFKFAWYNREKFTPADIYNTPTQFKAILSNEETNHFIPTPITEFNDICKGLMMGHLTVITGPEGQGKTEVLRMLEYHLLENHKDIPIGVLHMEESKKTCLLSLGSYKMKVNLRDPEHTVPQADIEKALAELNKDGQLYLFEVGMDEDPLVILDKIRLLVTIYGCKFVFIDPIQQLAYGKDYDDNETKMLDKISVQLERLATELNVGIVLTTHVNDDGQTRSSRMIGKSASVRIDLKRDHMNPDPDIRNRTSLSVSKNRPVGPTGYGGTLVFDPDTFCLQEDL